MIKKCYICSEPLIENVRPEHIIPDCIGGKLTSKDLLCNKCNNETGTTIDAAFCKLFLPLANKYNIKRRSIIPPATVTLETGEKVQLAKNWQMGYIDPITEQEGGLNIIRAGSKKRVLQELERIKAKLNPNEKFEFLKLERSISPGKTISFDLSGNWPLIFRSVVKMAANYYLYKTEDQSSIQPVLNFIKGTAGNNCVWFIGGVHANRMYPDKICHVLHFAGSKKDKCLFAYLEFFCLLGFFIVLNPRYEGDDVASTYVLDPVSSIELSGELKIEVKCGDIINYIISAPTFLDLKIKEI